MWKASKRKAGETESSDAGDSKPTKHSKMESSDNEEDKSFICEVRFRSPRTLFVVGLIFFTCCIACVHAFSCRRTGGFQ